MSREIKQGLKDLIQFILETKNQIKKKKNAQKSGSSEKTTSACQREELKRKEQTGDRNEEIAWDPLQKIMENMKKEAQKRQIGDRNYINKKILKQETENEEGKYLKIEYLTKLIK